MPNAGPTGNGAPSDAEAARAGEHYEQDPTLLAMPCGSFPDVVLRDERAQAAHGRRLLGRCFVLALDPVLEAS